MYPGRNLAIAIKRIVSRLLAVYSFEKCCLIYRASTRLSFLNTLDGSRQVAVLHGDGEHFCSGINPADLRVHQEDKVRDECARSDVDCSLTCNPVDPSLAIRDDHTRQR